MFKVPRSGIASFVKLQSDTFVGLICCLIDFHSFLNKVLKWSSVMRGRSHPLSTKARELPQVDDSFTETHTSAYSFFVSSGFGIWYVNMCGVSNEWLVEVFCMILLMRSMLTRWVGCGCPAPSSRPSHLRTAAPGLLTGLAGLISMFNSGCLFMYSANTP